MKKLLIGCMCLVCCCGFAAELKEKEANLTDIRVVSVNPTPEGDEIKTILVFPENNQILKSQPVNIQIRLEGFPLGIMSDFPRKREIFNSTEGQCMHIVIDNNPYFPINEAIVDNLENTEDYYEQILNFDIPFNLEEGMHVIRAFPARSFKESLKGDGCFTASVFYYKNKKSKFSIDLSEPYLTYNEPQGSFKFSPSKPILLDFYLTNCALSKDGYKVRVTIDKTIQRTLTQWTPFYIYGLKKGSHTIQLELLSPSNTPVGGYFNNISRSISIE